MAEYTPVSKINYDLFKQNYDPNLPYNQQSQTIQQKYNEDLFNKYSGIASEEPKLGFIDKFTGGLANLFAAQGAEPDYVNPNLAEMLAQQNYQNTLAYSPMFDNRNRFKEDIIPERMIAAPMDLESTMAGSILDKGITNRSLIGDLPNLNYRDYLSNLFNKNKTTQPDSIDPTQDDYASLYSSPELDTSRFTGVDLESGYLDRAGSYGQDVYSEEPTSLKGKTLQGIGKLMSYLPFGENSITGRLLRMGLPQESPEIKSMKNFYRNQYGLTPTGQVASGIMAGYNPVYGGALNMITGGRFGTPTQFGLANAARQRIENIAKRRAAQTDASRAKIAELQRFAEADTISRARQAAPDVYRDAGDKGRLGPGGGFSTSGSKKDSGFQSASSKPSGRGRQDY